MDSKALPSCRTSSPPRRTRISTSVTGSLSQPRSPGRDGHSGSGIVLGGVKGGMIEHSEAYGNGGESDAF